MPTLIQVPVEDPSCHNSGSSSDSSLDNTTMNMEEEATLNRRPGEAGKDMDETTLQDASVNLLEAQSYHSSSSSDDSSVSSYANVKQTRCSNRSNENNLYNKQTQKTTHKRVSSNPYSQTNHNTGSHKNEESYKSIGITNQENLSPAKSVCSSKNWSHASEDKEENSKSRIYLNETTMLSESTCSPVPEKKSAMKVTLKPMQPSRTNKDSDDQTHPRTKDTEISQCRDKSLSSPRVVEGKQSSQAQSILSRHTAGIPKRKPLELDWGKKAECEAFTSKLGKLVYDFERQNHVKLCDYRTLNPEDQRKEQERVVSLLDRLRIRGSGQEEGCKSLSESAAAAVGEDPIFGAHDTSITRLDDTVISFEDGGSPVTTATTKTEEVAVLASKKNGNKNENACVPELPQNELSAVLLSPIPGASPKHLKVHENSVRFTAQSPESNGGKSHTSFGGCGQDDSTMSQDSVEIPRGACNSPSSQSSLYRSPALERIHQKNAPKRLASTSGKRGFDKFRTKLNVSSSPETDNERMASPSHQLWSSPTGSISPISADGAVRHKHPFSASQSPITESDRRNRGDRSQPKLLESRRSRHRDDLHERYQHDETIDSVDVTMIRDRQKGRQRLREIPANIALKEGVPFHYNPLHVKKSKRTKRKDRTPKGYPCHHAVDFSDPLGSYMGDEGEDMYQVFEWMLQRDQNVDAHSTHRKERRCDDGCGYDSKGIIFSLDQNQIVNVSTKLLLAAEDTATDSYADCSSLFGQTLILVRAKDDIEIWERALREHTPFSVINHAALQCRDRKRSATATKCATFDVVLSTFDAAKAPDVTTQIDDDGYAVSRQGAESQADGWMIKRSGPANGSQAPSSEAIQCKQLSVLHRVNWRRIIFVDDLGRKCFLAKLGTARAFAAKALNGSSRFIFFTKTEEDPENSAFETLAKSDRRAIQSVASVLRLHLDEEDEEDATILDVIIDRDQGL